MSQMKSISDLDEIGVEGFRPFDRFKLWLNESGSMIQTMQNSLKFFTDHYTEAEISNALRPIRSPNVRKSEIIRYMEKISNIILMYDKIQQQLVNAKCYLEVFKHPVSKGMDIPEIKETQKLFKEVDCSVWIDLDKRFYIDWDYSKFEDRIFAEDASLWISQDVKGIRDVEILINACLKARDISNRTNKSIYYGLIDRTPLFPKGMTPTEQQILLAKSNRLRYLAVTNMLYDGGTLMMKMWYIISTLCIRLRKNL
jgi:hypothetical protein